MSLSIARSIVDSVASSIIGRASSSAVQLLYDTFTGVDGTLITAHPPDAGSAATGGTGTIVGNKLSGHAIYAMPQAPVEISYKHELALYGASLLFFRKAAFNQRWKLVSQRLPASLNVTLFLDTGAGLVSVANDLTTTYAAGQTIKVVDDGAVIRVFVGGVLVIPIVSVIHAGALGLEVQSPVAAAPLGIDDFEVL